MSLQRADAVVPVSSLTNSETVSGGLSGKADFIYSAAWLLSPGQRVETEQTPKEAQASAHLDA